MKQVLIIDDDPMFLRLYELQWKLLFKGADVNLITAQTSDKGIAEAVTHRPELILLDYNMTPEHGTVVSKRLKTDPRTLHIPIILVTSERKENIKGAIYDRFMGKPIKPDELKPVVEYYLNEYVHHDRPPVT